MPCPPPSSSRVDAASFAEEQRRLFADAWVAVASSHQVRQPGDLLSVAIGDRPIVLARDQEGGLRAFDNICPHRGLLLVEGCASGQAVIRCPYHSWSFALTGKLVATPHIGGHGVNREASIDPAAHGLTPVRADERHGVIFINQSGAAPDLAEHLQPLERRWPAYLNARLEHGGFVEFDVQANWKLAVENFVESYHLPWVHPGVSAYSPAEDHYDVIEAPLLIGQGNRTAASAPDMGGLPRFPGLSRDAERQGEFLLIFPNVLVIAMPDHYATIVITPVSAERTLERLDFWFLPGQGLDGERQAVIDRWAEINGEDQEILARLQVGRRSPAFRGGVLAPRWEQPVAAFHARCAEAMGAR